MAITPSTLSLIRPEDLLHLQFSFVNLVVNADDPKSPYLSRDNPDEDAYLIVFFPPQHLNEEAYFETENDFPNAPLPPNDPGSNLVSLTTPAHVHIAGLSRLVFRIPPEIRSIPYTMDGLLNWADLELSVVPSALPPDPLFTDPAQRPFLINPYLPENNIYTALELPYRLTLSPNHTAHWFHSLLPVTRNGRSELWHTRLGTQLPDGSSTEAPTDQRTVRAVWSFDFNPDSNDPPPVQPVPPPPPDFLASLNARDRHKLVHQSANFQLKSQTYNPKAIDVDKMMLTSQGAWMKIDGAWDVVDENLGNLGLNIESWKHTTTQGRDQFVRVVYAGFLYPFWHRASLVKITERKIQSPSNDDEDVTAFLRQRLYIIVRQPEKVYTHPNSDDRYNRANPFHQKIRILNRVTPNLDPPDYLPAPEESFWVHVAGQPFQFHLQAQDLAGKTIDFHTALIFVPFVPNEGNLSNANLNLLRTDYLKPAFKRLAQRGC